MNAQRSVSRVDRWTQVTTYTHARETTSLSRVEASTCVHSSTCVHLRPPAQVTASDASRCRHLPSPDTHKGREAARGEN